MSRYFSLCRPAGLAVLFVFLLAGALAPPASAQITWSGPYNVSGDSDVYTGGVSQYAYAPGEWYYNGSNWIQQMPQTVKGVQFQGVNNSTTWGNSNQISLDNIGNNYNGYGEPTNPALSSSYAQVLGGANYGNSGTATITLNNLVPGQQYAVQAWVQDTRDCCYNRTETVSSSGGNTVTLEFKYPEAAGSAGQYTVGTFTAAGASQSFYLGSGVGGTQLNAISLEAIVPVISWSTAGNISGPTDVSNAGSPVYAYNWNGNSSTIVNGVTFSGLNGANNSGGSSPNVTLSNFSVGYGGLGGGPVGYNGLMSGGIYNDAGNGQLGNGSVFLNNLVSGHTYAVEYWVNDSRSCCTNRAVTLSTPGGNNATLSYNVGGVSGSYGQYAVGTFTANGPTAGFSVAGANQDVQVNAVTVRDMTYYGTGFWSGTAGGTWDQNTTANFTTNLTTAAATFGTFAQATSATNIAYFGDYYYSSGNTVAVGTTAINVAAGGVSTGTVVFQNSANNYTLTSADSAGINGATLVSISGPGTVTFNGPNTYTGATSINAGSLVLGHTGAVQNSTVIVGTPNGLSFALGTTAPTLGGLSGDADFSLQDVGGNPVALTVGNNGAPTVYSGNMSGGGSLDKIGAGALSLTNVNTFTGALTINGGEVILPGGNGNSWLTGNPNIFVNGGGTLAFSNYNSFGVNPASMPAVTVNPGGVILSSNTVVLYNNLTLNSGTVSINGNDNYGGTWGSLGFAGTTTATGNAAINVISGNGSIQNGAGNAGFGTFTVLTPAATDTLAISAPIASSLALVKQGSGTLLLGSLEAVTTATSSFTGDININGGTVEVAAKAAASGNTALGQASNSRNINVNSGATLLIVAPNATAKDFNWTSVATLNINGGTVTNAEPGGAFPAGKINNALNNVNLNSGVLTATTGQHEPSGPSYAAWNINGTITSTGNSLISTTDPVYGTVMLANGGAALGTTTIDVASGTLTVSAPLVQDDADNNVSGLKVAGAGLLVLTATNTYTGGTTVSGGTLILTNNEAIADGTSLTVGDPSSFAPAPVVPAAAASAVAPVPEPGTLALLAAAAAVALGIWRKRS